MKPFQSGRTPALAMITCAFTLAACSSGESENVATTSGAVTYTVDCDCSMNAVEFAFTTQQLKDPNTDSVSVKICKDLYDAKLIPGLALGTRPLTKSDCSHSGNPVARAVQAELSNLAKFGLALPSPAGDDKLIDPQSYSRGRFAAGSFKDTDCYGDVDGHAASMCRNETDSFAYSIGSYATLEAARRQYGPRRGRVIDIRRAVYEKFDETFNSHAKAWYKSWVAGDSAPDDALEGFSKAGILNEGAIVLLLRKAYKVRAEGLAPFPLDVLRNELDFEDRYLSNVVSCGRSALIPKP